MTGTDLATFCEQVNGGDSINTVLLTQFVGIAKALIEQRRPWMVLRKVDNSKSIASSNNWQTPIDLSTLTRFNRFYGDYPVRLFDGNQNVHRYRQIPFLERLGNLSNPDTFVYDEGNQTLYLSGTPPFAGTLYLAHLQDTDDPVLDASWTWKFPSWSHPLLGLMAVGINKGGVDWDDIHARMAPDNRALAEQIAKMLENWDNEKQLSEINQYDPYSDPGDWTPGAINIGA